MFQLKTITVCYTFHQRDTTLNLQLVNKEVCHVPPPVPAENNGHNTTAPLPSTGNNDIKAHLLINHWMLQYWVYNSCLLSETDIMEGFLCLGSFLCANHHWWVTTNSLYTSVQGPSMLGCMQPVEEGQRRAVLPNTANQEWSNGAMLYLNWEHTKEHPFRSPHKANSGL